MFLLILAGYAGAAVAGVLLWPFGVLIALAGASLGGSLSAGLAGGVIAWRNPAKPLTIERPEARVAPGRARAADGGRGDGVLPERRSDAA